MTRTTTGRRRVETPTEWLEELGASLRMPYERAEAIREELAEHLRERVRDLELEGLDEAAAASVAVRELGDAAAVARRFRNAERTPIRRRLMNLAVIGIAGAALATSIVAMNRSECPPEETPRVLLERAISAMDETMQPEPPRAYAELALRAMETPPGGVELQFSGPGKVKLDYAVAPTQRRTIMAELLTMTLPNRPGTPPDAALEPLKAENMRLEEVLQWMAAQAKSTPIMRSKQIEDAGISLDEQVTVNIGAAGFAAAMTAVNEARGVFSPTDARWIEFRTDGGTIEFAPRSFFDRREATVVRYDIAELLETGVEFDQLRELITTFVEPDLWAENGGDLAFMKFVGGKVFVKAPPRMHESVKWFIEQLSEQRQESSRRESSFPEEVRNYPLKHASASDVLKAIMTNSQIRAIDFTHFVADDRTNSIVGRTTTPEHRIVKDAIEALDVEASAAAR